MVFSYAIDAKLAQFYGFGLEHAGRQTDRRTDQEDAFFSHKKVMLWLASSIASLGHRPTAHQGTWPNANRSDDAYGEGFPSVLGI